MNGTTSFGEGNVKHKLNLEDEFLLSKRVIEHVLKLCCGARDVGARLYHRVTNNDEEHMPMTDELDPQTQQHIDDSADTIDDCDLLLIHDGARPLVTRDEILDTLHRAEETGAAATGVFVKDTIKGINDDYEITDTPDRSQLIAIQTPQIFRFDLYKQAMEKAKAQGGNFTDDCKLMENLGVPVSVVIGEYTNMKITTPEDLPMAEAILKAREAE